MISLRYLVNSLPPTSTQVTLLTNELLNTGTI